MNRTIYFDLKFPMGTQLVTVAITDHFFSDSADTGSIPHNHSHPGFELQYITEGEGFIQSGTQKHRIRKGNVLLLPPNLTHVVVRDAKSPVRRITFLFFISKPLEDRRRDAGDEIRRVVEILEKVSKVCVLEDGAEIHETFLSIGQEIIDKKLGYLEKLKAVLEGLLIDIARGVSDIPVAGRIPQPADVDANRAQFIEDYFNSIGSMPCRRADLAQKLFLSEKQLERILKRLYQKPFRELLLQSRMEMADYFLAEGELSMAEIAIQLGYSSVNAFGFAYRNYYGVTAGAKKKLLRQ